MSLILTGNSSTLTVDSTSGITFPNSTIQAVAAQTGPAFSAYQSIAQSVPNAVFTKLQFQTELWDTNNNFDSTTNYRFTPTVAGYYQLSSAVQMDTAVAGIQVLAIYKNGSVFLRGTLLNTNTSYGSAINGLVYANGSTDYFEIYLYQGRGSAQNTDAGSSAYTYFQGFLARVA